VSSRLVKVEGAGNDFILGTGVWAQRLADDAALVIKLCDRHRGVGADGALAVFVEGNSTICLVHRNADGSPSAFCANGTRCAAHAAVEFLGLPRTLVVSTGWVEIPAVVSDSEVSLELPPPTAPFDRTLVTDHGTWRGRQLELGTPHLVLPVDDLDTLAFESVAPVLRCHPSLGPAGANVHFVVKDPGLLRIRSFERGVEAETLCCGSGVVVSALLALESTGADSISVEPRSGDRLTVEALGRPPTAPSRLTGPARLVAEIDLLD
jgi:diaminopimelate epimerase